MANIEKFIQESGVRIVHIRRQPTRYQPHAYMRSPHAYYDEPLYYDNEEIIEMELSRPHLERLADFTERAEDIMNEMRDERYLRSKHPAIEDAYSKYQMLLALYK